MNGAVLALAIAGVVSFFAGAYLAATDNRTLGIVLMANGLLFQVLCLRQLKSVNTKDNSDAG